MISTELAKTTPISEDALESLCKQYLDVTDEEMTQGIEKLLTKLTELPEATNYKFLVYVTKFGGVTGGIKCFTGAHWNSSQDGTWVHRLEGKHPSMVTVTWIRT